MKIVFSLVSYTIGVKDFFCITEKSFREFMERNKRKTKMQAPILRPTKNNLFLMLSIGKIVTKINCVIEASEGFEKI